jgi:hypothetical protein
MRAFNAPPDAERALPCRVIQASVNAAVEALIAGRQKDVRSVARQLSQVFAASLRALCDPQPQPMRSPPESFEPRRRGSGRGFERLHREARADDPARFDVQRDETWRCSDGIATVSVS